jgi:hypothetical protein
MLYYHATPEVWLGESGTMTEHFTIDAFADRTGETFTIHPDDARSLPVTLTEVADLTSTSGPGVFGRPRAPFSLVFHGPPDVVLPQQIYRLEHPELGSFELFLVAIGPDGRGQRYQAIFT